MVALAGGILQFQSLTLKITNPKWEPLQTGDNQYTISSKIIMLPIKIQLKNTDGKYCIFLEAVLMQK